MKLLKATITVCAALIVDAAISAEKSEGKPDTTPAGVKAGNADIGITFIVPNGFELYSLDHPGPLKAQIDKKTPFYLVNPSFRDENINIQVIEGVDVSQLNGMKQELERNPKMSIRGYKRIGIQNVSVGKNGAFTAVEHVFQMKGNVLGKMRAVTFVIGKRGYTITCGTSVERFEKANKGFFEPLLSSIEAALMPSPPSVAFNFGSVLNEAFKKKAPSDIFAAVLARNIEEVKLFISKDKSAVNAQNGYGSTALHVLASTAPVRFTVSNLNSPSATLTRDDTADENTLKIATLLIEAGANLNAKDKSDSTPLIQAILNNQPKLVTLLAEKGSNVSLPIEQGVENYGFQALHVAVGRGQTEMIAVLVEKGAKINAKSDNGTTPLHIAAMRNDLPTTKELLKLGADINIENRRGQTPIDVARSKGNTEVIAILESQK